MADPAAAAQRSELQFTELDDMPYYPTDYIDPYNATWCASARSSLRLLLGPAK